MAGKQTINPELGIAEGGKAEDFLIADSNVIQKMWGELSKVSSEYKINNISRDYSENGSVVLAGRCLLPDTKTPTYWAVRDNRVHFSSFKDLSEHDKMTLANQVLVSYANRSQKDDIKSAALAISERGHFYVAMNTQESPTMHWDKECAESNVTRIVKQLSRTDDKIGRIYVLGGLTDEEGKMHVQDHLVGMCMRCVETVSPVMSPESKVTIIPANDGKEKIALRECNAIEYVKPQEAWQVPYMKLKEPSIVAFPADVSARQDDVFSEIKSGKINMTSKKLEAGATEQEINAHMVAELAKAVKARDGKVSHIGIAVLEISDADGKHVKFEEAMQIKGPRDNASLPAISGAVNHAALPIPKTASERVSKAYLIGYNADGTPYDMSSEVGDRLLKRVGKERAASVEVVCIPLNDGKEYPVNDVIRKKVHDLAPTAFPGSKQHGFRQDCC